MYINWITWDLAQPAYHFGIICASSVTTANTFLWYTSLLSMFLHFSFWSIDSGLAKTYEYWPRIISVSTISPVKLVAVMPRECNSRIWESTSELSGQMTNTMASLGMQTLSGEVLYRGQPALEILMIFHGLLARWRIHLLGSTNQTKLCFVRPRAL